MLTGCGGCVKDDDTPLPTKPRAAEQAVTGDGGDEAAAPRAKHAPGAQRFNTPPVENK